MQLETVLADNRTLVKRLIESTQALQGAMQTIQELGNALAAQESTSEVEGVKEVRRNLPKGGLQVPI